MEPGSPCGRPFTPSPGFTPQPFPRTFIDLTAGCVLNLANDRVPAIMLLHHLEFLTLRRGKPVEFSWQPLKAPGSLLILDSLKSCDRSDLEQRYHHRALKFHNTEFLPSVRVQGESTPSPPSLSSGLLRGRGCQVKMSSDAQKYSF